jgi:Tfp pilus assembly protein PilX
MTIAITSRQTSVRAAAAGTGDRRQSATTARPEVLRHVSPQRQSGVVLVIALIVLVALTLSGVALVRSTDTGTMISGNMAFRQAAVHAVDTGVESAFVAISAAGGFAASPATSTVTAAGRYSSTILPDAAPADGLPDVDWSAVPGVAVSGNTVRWVVERLCSTNAATPAEIERRCTVIPTGQFYQSYKMGVITPSANALAVAYRVTVRVEGPRNTVVFSQSVITL